MRTVAILGVSLMMITPALAQVPSIADVNNPIASPVCDLINFAFCPQPGSPPPPFPDPEADATPPRPVPPPIHRKRMHKPLHRHHG